MCHENKGRARTDRHSATDDDVIPVTIFFLKKVDDQRVEHQQVGRGLDSIIRF